jgi:hypothetical protein
LARLTSFIVMEFGFLRKKYDAPRQFGPIGEERLDRSKEGHILRPTQGRILLLVVAFKCLNTLAGSALNYTFCVKHEFPHCFVL